MKQVTGSDCCGSDKPAASKSRAASKRNHRDEVGGKVAPHPDHSAQLARLNRVIGQVEGIKRMIESRRYCPEILVQTRAVSSALKSIELGILGKHVRHCVSEALVTKNLKQSETKVEELISVLDRF